MRAAIYHGANQPMPIEDVEVDDPWPREVLVRTAASGVCHSDLMFVDGIGQWPTPGILGHEGSGLVEAIGADVTYVQPGDRVIVTGVVFCGACEECLSDNSHRCLNRPRRRRHETPRLTLNGESVLALTNVGSFAEYMLVPEAGVVKLPDDVPLETACLLGCGVITGLGAVFRAAELKPGTTAAVFGLGGVGLSAVQGARIAGASRIIAVDLTDEKLERARLLGATDVVNASEVDDPVEAIRDLTEGRGVHYSFEAIGTRATAEQAFACIREGGTASIIGAGISAPLQIPPNLLIQDRRIQGVFMGRTRSRVDIPRYFELYRQGKLKLDEMVTRRGRLEDLDQAFEDQRAHVGARTILLFD